MERDWRAYHPDLPPDAGATIELAPDESHHIHRVLRLQPGDALRVFTADFGFFRWLFRAAPYRLLERRGSCVRAARLESIRS